MCQAPCPAAWIWKLISHEPALQNVSVGEGRFINKAQLYGVGIHVKIKAPCHPGRRDQGRKLRVGDAWIETGHVLISASVNMLPFTEKCTWQMWLNEGSWDGEITPKYPGGSHVITEVFIGKREAGARGGDVKVKADVSGVSVGFEGERGPQVRELDTGRDKDQIPPWILQKEYHAANSLF